MESWTILTLIYGLLSGVYYIFQKKAMSINHSIEVFVTYVTISLIIVFFNVGNVITINPNHLILIALKSLMLFISFVLSFKAMSKLSVSLYGVINMSKILFTSLLGIIVLNETFGRNQLIGMILICLGLLLVNIYKDDKGKNDKKYVLILLVACVFSSISGLLDKIISTNVTPLELQWWYLLFLFIYTWIYVLVRKVEINFKSTFKNYWIYLYSIAFILADRLLFMANRIEGSQISIISLLKQISVIIMVLIGGKIFKEKNLRYKLLCCLIIILGLGIIVIGG